MMRSRFDEQLAELNKDLLEMGALCEEVISMSAKALLTRDNDLAKNVIAMDQDIDRMEREIESLCLRILLRQQPVAKDLRQISAALKMITDMERIGDQAADIAEMISFLAAHSTSDHRYIEEMAKATTRMVTDSVDAFVRRDLDDVERVIAEDDIVDDLFIKVRKTLIELIANHPEEGEYAVDLLMIAKYFERIGDHAENLAEWVEFSITGVHRGGQEP